MPYQRSTLFLIAVAVLVVLLLPAALLWRRFYRDDPANTARRVFKNSAVPLALRLLVRALDLAFLVMLQRNLRAFSIGPYDFATLLVGQYLTTITEFGLGVLLTRDVARDPGAAKQLFGTTLLLRWLLVILGAAPVTWLLISGYGTLGRFGLGEAISPTGQQVIWVMALTLLPGAYSGAVTALYNANERMEVPALVEVVTGVVGFAARLAALLIWRDVVMLAWASVLVTTLTALIYFVLQTRTFFVPTLSWDSGAMRSLLPQALPLMLNNLLNVVFFRFDTFILKAFGNGNGDLLVAQYNTAYKVLSIAMILPPVITFAVFPVLSRRAGDDRQGMLQAQNRTLQVLLWLGFPLAMGLSILARDLILLIAGDNAGDYLPAAQYALAILAWFLPLSFANGLLQYVLIAVHRQRAITRAFVIGAACNLLVNLATIPFFGMFAASINTILSEILLLLLFTPVLRNEGLQPPLIKLMWRPALATLIMGGIMLLATQIHWLLAMLVAAPVYAAALWLLGAFGTEERALVRRILGRS